MQFRITYRVGQAEKKLVEKHEFINELMVEDIYAEAFQFSEKRAKELADRLKLKVTVESVVQG